MPPCDWPIWYNQHTVINLVNMHNQLPCHLPHQYHTTMSCHISIRIAMSHSLSATMLASILPSHPSTSTSVQPHVVRTAMCHLVIGPRQIQPSMCYVHTVPRVIFVLVQLSPKMPNRVTRVTSSCFHMSLLTSL
jgi:hypothetical protein